MTEQECLDRMVAPGTRRPGKYREGVIQIHVTRSCDKACFNCTQGSNLGGKTTFMPPELFEQAVLSLKGYFGVVGVFGGNPALSPHFPEYCEILRRHVPKEQRGIWSNNPVTVDRAKLMRETFDPSVSNLNVHLDKNAFELFKMGWPESHPVGLYEDSRHSPCYVAMKDVGVPEDQRWELISRCDINQHWSAMIGVFRGQLRAWFCEIAGAQAMLHQDEPDYPDLGVPILNSYPDGKDHAVEYGLYQIPLADLSHPRGFEIKVLRWWEFPMQAFTEQVRQHCHDCGVPLRGHGELSQQDDDKGKEQVSVTHANVYKPKRKHRPVEVVTELVQLGTPLGRMTNYLGNAKV